MKPIVLPSAACGRLIPASATAPAVAPARNPRRVLCMVSSSTTCSYGTVVQNSRQPACGCRTDSDLVSPELRRWRALADDRSLGSDVLPLWVAVNGREPTENEHRAHSLSFNLLQVQ